MSPVVYKIKDLDGESLEGAFYTQELQKVKMDPETEYKIEKIIKKRKRRGHEELLVKWMGWSEKFNSWVKKTDIVRL